MDRHVTGLLGLSAVFLTGGCGATGAPDLVLTMRDKIDSLAWIAYAPTGFDPERGIFPSEESIRADLELLLEHAFDGVITFASDGTLAQVPRIARDVGFRGVVMGLFLFDDAQRAVEVPNAVAAAEHVDGYAVGNEGLIGCGGALYSADVLQEIMDQLRAATGKPVSTAEQIEDYLDGGCLDGFLFAHSDWLFPVVHPFNNGIREVQEGVAFTLDRVEALRALTTRPILLKETGWPTCGDAAATEDNQERYFLGLQRTAVRFAFFEAFDQPFKASFPLPWEPCWGLFGSDRSPKLFVARNQPERGIVSHPTTTRSPAAAARPSASGPYARSR